MTRILLILLILIDLVILFTPQRCSTPALTTRFALSFCNGYGDLVGDFIFTCYPKEYKI